MSASNIRSADQVLTNGRILTMDGTGGVVEAIAVKAGRIVAIGTSNEMRDLVGNETRVTDLDGHVALPGMGDCHMHLAGDAANLSYVDVRDIFTGVRSIPQILDLMRERARTTPPGEWVIARGSPIQDMRLDERRRLTKDDLDPALPDHPAIVFFGAHITMCNSRALKERGITKDTVAPAGGTIELDPETGEPTGILKERAQYLVRERTPVLDQHTLEENIRTLLEQCRSRGATTIHDMVVSGEQIRAYINLAKAGRLPVRVHLLIRVIESDIDKESLLDLGIVDGFGDDFLKIGGIKMSIDGGTTGRNGAFGEPLIGEPDNHGIIRIDQDELDETVARYHRMGMRVCLHAVGDVAHKMALSAVERALEANPRSDHRHRIEHLGNWMFTDEELAWAKRLDVIPMPNPTGLRYVADIYAPLLGDRMRWSYRFGTILRAGFRTTFTSDGPGGYPCDPLRDAGTVVSRKTANGNVYGPDEAVSVEAALTAQTANAAYVGFEETRLGSIEPGKLADVVVLGEDPFEFPPERFSELPVDRVIVAGEETYTRI